jgi:hypothetical protein
VDFRGLNALGLDPAAADVIGGYLAELECRLPGGRRYRARILAEIADGLACAVLDRTDAGAAPAATAREVVAEFGAPGRLAAAFARQLGPVTAHRVGLGLVATGPLVGLAWLAAYANGAVGLPARVAGLLGAMPQLVVILAVTVPAAITATAGVGWAARHLALPAGVVTGAALMAVIGCVTGDLSLLLSVILGRGQGGGPLVVAAAASVTRLIGAGWAGRRVARLRVAAH